MRFGVKENDHALCDKVQDMINDMKTDGTMKKISEKWFGSDITIIK